MANVAPPRDISLYYLSRIALRLVYVVLKWWHLEIFARAMVLLN